MQLLPIHTFLTESKQGILIDVRSPAEYLHAHIPNAVNIPLFDNEERKQVGTVYKQHSRELAIKLGLEFFGPKMRAMVEEVEEIAQGKSIYLYCWRGGMRSGAVAWLLEIYGIAVFKLDGGYKAFRNYILDSFKMPRTWNVIGGYSGSGKTAILKILQKKGEQVIDFESLANHKGSALGGIGMGEQPSQEHFENLIGLNLFYLIDGMAIWVEDESLRIGDRILPKPIFSQIQTSVLYFIEMELEERLERILEEYKGLSLEKMVFAVIRIKKRLGGMMAKNIVAALLDKNIKEAFRYLLQYYDKQYDKSLKGRMYEKLYYHRKDSKSIAIHLLNKIYGG